MKKLLLLVLPSVLLVAATIFSAFGPHDAMNPNGSPAGYTNSPGDGMNCSHCMPGSVATVSGWITSNVPASGYVPGTSYTITATATGSGNKGYQISPQTTAGGLIGTLTAGSGSKLVGSGKYVTHTTAVAGATATWTFTWKAPAAGAGDVTFYGSFIVSSAFTKVCTMTVSQSTVGISEKDLSGISVFPNPAKDHFSVSFSHAAAGTVNMELLTMSGVKVSDLLNETIASGNFTRSFSISQPAGIYLVKITSGDQKEIRKVIVQ